MSGVIDSFFNENRFLSNFYLHIVVFEEGEYPSNEHAYQAAKTINKKDRIPFQTQKSIDAAGLELKEITPMKAKIAGNKLDLRPNWDNDEVKVKIMQTLVDTKFDDFLMEDLLLTTGTDELIEGNYWNDTFWGKCKGVGRNELGKALMKTRQKKFDILYKK